MHIPPAQVDDLSVSDFVGLVDWCDRHEAAIAAANREAGG